VPVHNSEGTIDPLVTRIVNTLAGRDGELEIILVDDGSRDSSWDAIQAQRRRHPCVRGLRLMRNYGQHNALLAGIQRSRGDYVVTLDDDLEQPPEAIPELLGLLDREPVDVVYGARAGKRERITREWEAKLFRTVLGRGLRVGSARGIAPLRAFRGELREVFRRDHGPHISIDALLGWGTTRFASVEVSYAARDVGRSSYGFARRLRHAMLEVTGFTTLPLRIASVLGLLMTVFGLGVLAYVVVRYLIDGREVPGFAFLASIISLFAGAQLLALGVIGEYLARVHERTMERPPYVVRESDE
jgi:undecaprenyl-phosphate 4-deoxy-4-formamido-L-arabinose transferase